MCHSWSKPIVTGTPPSRRRAHAAVYYDSRIIIFGGGNGAHALNDVHALDLSDARQPEWIELSVRGRPPIARGYHTMNLVGNKAIVFGGSDGAECFGDVFILDLGAWGLFPAGSVLQLIGLHSRRSAHLDRGQSGSRPGFSGSVSTPVTYLHDVGQLSSGHRRT